MNIFDYIGCISKILLYFITNDFLETIFCRKLPLKNNLIIVRKKSKNVYLELIVNDKEYPTL